MFADPQDCNCLLVGDAKAYQEYQRLRLQKQVADEFYAMPHNALDWTVWGPWTPGRWP